MWRNCKIPCFRTWLAYCLVSDHDKGDPSERRPMFVPHDTNGPATTRENTNYTLRWWQTELELHFYGKELERATQIVPNFVLTAGSCCRCHVSELTVSKLSRMIYSCVSSIVCLHFAPSGLGLNFLLSASKRRVGFQRKCTSRYEIIRGKKSRVVTRSKASDQYLNKITWQNM